MKITIRPASTADLAAVLNLVRELADFEESADVVTADLSNYRTCFKEGVFEAIVAEVAGTVVGTCIYYMTFSTWKGKMLYLEDFVVTDSLRRSGIGKQLFEAVIDIAKDRGCALLKWQVLDWNQSAIDFYKKYDTVFDHEWWNGKIYF